MEGKRKHNKIKLDQMMKLLFRSSSKGVMVNLLNALFKENYDNDIQIEYSNNEFISDSLQRLYGDVFLTVRQKCKAFNYHIEFQTLNDSSMAIRMFRYGLEKAIENLQNKNNDRLYYPKQLVIFLEENRNIEDELSVELEFPNGQEIKLTIPVLKYWKYSTKSLKNKKLYVLLPLQVFKARKKIKAISESKSISKADKHRQVETEFKKLDREIKSVEEVSHSLYRAGEINGDDLGTILLVMQNISNYLYRKYREYKHISEEMENMLAKLNPVLAKEVEKKVSEEWMAKMEEERIKTAKTAIRLLVKRLGILPEEMKNKLEKLDTDTLNTIIEGIFEYSSLDDIEKHLI